MAMNNTAPTNAEIVNHDSFAKLKAKNRRKNLRRKLFSLIVILLLCGALAFLCITLFFGLKTTKVIGNSKYSAEDIIKACNFDSSTNLLSISYAKTEEKLRAQFPYIGKVEFERKLPSTLVITVNEDVPTFYTEIYGDWFLLSEDLRIISRHDSSEAIKVKDLDVIKIKLPSVSYAVSGEKVQFTYKANYTSMTNFLHDLKSLNLIDDIGFIDATNRYHISVYSSDGRYKILLGDASELETKLLFINKIIKTSFSNMTIAEINAELVSSITVLKQNERFRFD